MSKRNTAYTDRQQTSCVCPAHSTGHQHKLMTMPSVNNASV